MSGCILPARYAAHDVATWHDPSNLNTPPRVMLLDCPIVALHWFGLDISSQGVRS